MTVNEMVTELAASLGNRTDITTARYLNWLNWAQYDLCGTHRKRAFRPKRFRALEATGLFSVYVTTGTVSSGNTTSAVLPSVPTTGYVDWIVEFTAYDEAGAGQTTPAGLLNNKRIITANVAGSPGLITWTTPLTNGPDAYTTYTLYKRVWSIPADLGLAEDVFWGFQRIENAEDGTALIHKDWFELSGTDATSTGTPTSFARRGDTLVLDPTPDETITFRFYYYKYPTQFVSTNLTAQPDLPEYWHEAIILGAIWRGFERLMEPERANAAYQLYQQEVTNRIDEYMIESKYRPKGMRMRYN